MTDLKTIRKFNRFELKYILTLKQAAQFKSALGSFLMPDEYGSNNGRYTLYSLYYDSPDLRCYHEKEYGEKIRRKLRIRYYKSERTFTDQTPVFVEIKQRIDRVTQKRRVVLPYADALKLCNDRQMPPHSKEDQETIQEIYAFLWEYNLRPTRMISYTRQALVGTDYDLGLRVTFDTALATHLPPYRLHALRSPLSIFPANYVVAEIKVNERIPTWLVNLIASHNLNGQRISKYCRSIEATQDNPVFMSSSMTVESAADVLASTISIYDGPRAKVFIPKKNK